MRGPSVFSGVSRAPHVFGGAKREGEESIGNQFLALARIQSFVLILVVHLAGATESGKLVAKPIE